ncbi:MAG TPA: S-adenosylmethionine:tRNA ribosyltransferase-isomerase, partial [Burkholderiaceae bacterium]|nr:S-adenosylmethionine:tRNA ribosyltransferase-isomerase [Burkholderiaceae bacterium]
MQLSDFDFDLPPELIAQHPAAQRGASRLLAVPAGLPPQDRRFDELPELLASGDLLVLNDTRVIRARLFGRKDSGGRVEALIERVIGEHEAIAMLRASKPPRHGARIAWTGSSAEAVRSSAEVLGRAGEFWQLRFDEPVLRVLEREGLLPLPPYITHVPDADDERRYQTVYAQAPGSVSAPTAGLHF